MHLKWLLHHQSFICLLHIPPEPNGTGMNSVRFPQRVTALGWAHAVCTWHCFGDCPNNDCNLCTKSAGDLMLNQLYRKRRNSAWSRISHMASVLIVKITLQAWSKCCWLRKSKVTMCITFKFRWAGSFSTKKKSFYSSFTVSDNKWQILERMFFFIFCCSCHCLTCK